MTDKIVTLTSSKQRTAFFGKAHEFGIIRPADKIVTGGLFAIVELADGKLEDLDVPIHLKRA